MRKFIITINLLSIFFLLSGCADSMNKQGAGTLIGGVAGGLIGSRFGKGEGQLLATGVGALAGAFIGNQIGKNLDEQDRRILELSSQRALETAPSGNSVEWRNPDSGNYGYVTPTKTIHDSNTGRYCREYTQTIVVGGQTEKAYSRACRMPDGSWQIEN
jgi:surface antigen